MKSQICPLILEEGSIKLAINAINWKQKYVLNATFFANVKCNGRRPECSRCAAYGYKCSYSDRTGEFSRYILFPLKLILEKKVCWILSTATNVGRLQKIDGRFSAEIGRGGPSPGTQDGKDIGYFYWLLQLNDDDPTSEPMGFRSTSSIYAEHLDTPINDASSSQDATSVFPSACETPSSSDSSTTFLGSGSDISFIRSFSGHSSVYL